MARKSTLAVKDSIMQMNLRVTSVTPHADGTQTITLAQPLEPIVARPTPRPIVTHPLAVGSSGEQFPGPVQVHGRVGIVLTNWPNTDSFSVGRDYRIDVSTV